MHKKGDLIYGIMPANIRMLVFDIDMLDNGKYTGSGTYPYDFDTSINYWSEAKFHLTQTMSSNYSENIWRFPDSKTTSFSSPWSITSPMTTLTLTIDTAGGGCCWAGFYPHRMHLILEDYSFVEITDFWKSLQNEEYSYVLPITCQWYCQGYYTRGVRCLGKPFIEGSNGNSVINSSLMFTDHSQFTIAGRKELDLECCLYGARNGYINYYFPIGMYVGGKFIPIYFRNIVQYDSTDISFTVNKIFTYYAPAGSTWQSFISNTNYSKILNGNSEFSIYSNHIRYRPIYGPFLDGNVTTNVYDTNDYLYLNNGANITTGVVPQHSIVDGGQYYSYYTTTGY